MDYPNLTLVWFVLNSHFVCESILYYFNTILFRVRYRSDADSVLFFVFCCFLGILLRDKFSESESISLQRSLRQSLQGIVFLLHELRRCKASGNTLDQAYRRRKSLVE